MVKGSDPEKSKDLYSTDNVKNLFGEMSQTYGLVNMLSSFGFALRWRRQCILRAGIKAGHTVYDFMTGMGECIPLINASARKPSAIRGVDFCPEMCSRARVSTRRLGITEPEAILEEDILETSLETNSADRVVCAFGLKTMDPSDLRALALQVYRVLRPGGRFSFVEISEPRNPVLRLFYLSYVRYLIPVFGLFLLGNPSNYSQLGVYMRKFRDCSHVREVFENVGLQASDYSLFFGCATGIAGEKPKHGSTPKRCPGR